MRRITLVGTFLALLLLVAACDSFLSVPPETFVSSEEFYENPTEIELAVAGLYANVQSLHNTLQWAFGEFRSDNTSFQFEQVGRGRVTFENISTFLLKAGNGYVESYWQTSYNGIMRSNNILAHIGGVTFEDETVKNTRIGETKFFRAYHYFNLVRLFGNVPIVTEPITTPAESAEPRRAPVDQAFDEVIIPDALDAVEELPVSYPTSETGRITKGAARTLLAKVYMWRENWSAAEEQLRAIIASGQYSLLSDYAAIFAPDNKNNAEIIYSIQYQGGQDNGEASNFMSGGLGFAPAQSGAAVIGAGVEGFTGVHTTAGKNQPTRSMIEAYEEGDERKAASLKTFFVTAEGDTVREAYIYKYCCHLIKPGQEDVNWPVYRYADVLLMLAEALYEQGRAGEGLSYLNQVRERAGLEPLSTLTHEAIRHERRVELAFENHRWFNLLRWGMAKEVMQAQGERQKALKETVPPAAFTHIRTLLPIPDEEVQAFGYEQNPGW